MLLNSTDQLKIHKLITNIFSLMNILNEYDAFSLKCIPDTNNNNNNKNTVLIGPKTQQNDWSFTSTLLCTHAVVHIFFFSHFTLNKLVERFQISLWECCCRVWPNSDFSSLFFPLSQVRQLSEQEFYGEKEKNSAPFFQVRNSGKLSSSMLCVCGHSVCICEWCLCPAIPCWLLMFNRSSV